MLECHHITGAWNYLLKVRVGTTRDLERFLTDTIKAVDGVEQTETLILPSSIKETWRVNRRAQHALREKRIMREDFRPAASRPTPRGNHALAAGFEHCLALSHPVAWHPSNSKNNKSGEKTPWHA